MAKLPLLTQSVAPQQGYSGRQASASDLGPDMSGLARGLNSLAGDLAEIEQQKETLAVAKQATESALTWQQHFEEEANKQPLGAPDFTKKMDANFQDYTNKVYDDLRKKGWSESAIEKLSLRFDGMRLTNQSQAISFESQSAGAKAKADMADIADNSSRLVAINPAMYESSVKEAEATIDALPKLDAIQRQQLKNAVKSQILNAGVAALAKNDPDKVIRLLTPGTYQEKVTKQNDVIQGVMDAADPKPSDTSGVKFIDRTQGKVRHLPVQPVVKSQIAAAAKATGDNIAIELVSGGQPTKEEAAALRAKGVKGALRTGSTRHDHGNAADIVLVVNGKRVLPSENPELYAKFFENAAAAGMTGLGHYSWGVHVGGGSEVAWGPDRRSRTIDPVFAAAIQRGRERAAKGDPLSAAPAEYVTKTFTPVDTATGDPILDALDGKQRIEIVNAAQAELARRATAKRGELNQKVEDASSEYLTTGEYAGTPPTRKDFYDAYPDDPGQAEDRYQSFLTTAEVGKNIAAFKTSPTEEIMARVEAMKPTPGDPSYAEKQKGYEIAQAAAGQIMKARQEDPAAYVQKQFPAVQNSIEVYTNATDPTEKSAAFSSMLTQMDAAYDQIGAPPDRRSYLPKAKSDEVLTRFGDTNLPFDQRIAAPISVVLAAKDPQQQKAIFEQLVRKDNSFAKFRAAFEAAARGDEGAAKRLFQAGMTDPDKLPGALPNGVKPEDIPLAIDSQIMAPGMIGDAVYGLPANVKGNEERARRDTSLMVDAVKYNLRTGKTLEQAVEQAKQDIYGNVDVITADKVTATVPKDIDQEVFMRGIDAVTERAKAEIEAAKPEMSDPVRAEKARIAQEEMFDAADWRPYGEGYALIEPIMGRPLLGADGQPVVYTLDQIMKAAENHQLPAERRQQNLDDATKQYFDQQSDTFGNMGGAP